MLEFGQHLHLLVLLLFTLLLQKLLQLADLLVQVLLEGELILFP